MKRLFLAVLLVLCLPGYALAEGALLKGEEVTIEGTIQGLLSACTGQLCVPGQESIIAAVEDTYVLSVGKDKYYHLPNVKNTLLSRYLGQTVRVKGMKSLGGGSILVDTAEVMEDGNWRAIYSPKIRKQITDRYQFAPYDVD